MSVRVKKWLFLPFGGGYTEYRRGNLPNGNGPITGNGNEKTGNGNGDGDTGLKEESPGNYAEMNEEDAVEDFNAPITWWVVSTLFPLIAGTFGPIASAFNILAVTIDFRIYVMSGSKESEGAHIPDPQWLVAVNAVSLAIAIISNIFLLAIMTGRIRFNIAAPINIIGWYISGFIDIILVAVARSVLPLPAGATFSQAYYYACFAGGLYVLLAMMLSCTAAGVWIFHITSEFKLTLNQRSLMLQTILYLAYLELAGLVYAHIEGWNFLDAVYFVNVTLLTIGFGDYSPATHLGRSLLFPMAVGGIIFVGLIIANIRALVLESGSRKISTRMLEKARAKATKTGDPRMLKLGRGLQLPEQNANSRLERRAQEFHLMRVVQAQAAFENRMITLAVSSATFFVLWLLGALVFWQAEMALGGENWTYFEALYFTYISLLTIGYGDFYPQTNSGKPAFVFWSLIALPALTVLIGSIGDAVSDFANWATEIVGKSSMRFANAIAGIKKEIEETVDGPSFSMKGISKDDSFEAIAHAEAMGVLTRQRLDMTEADIAELRERRAADAAGYAYRPYMILKEIKNIFGHIEAASTSSRQYSFAEWTWLLALMDEEAADKGHEKSSASTVGGKDSQSQEITQQDWSWMDQKSPLMSSENEPTWIFKRLIDSLERELKMRGDHHINEIFNKEGVDKTGTRGRPPKN